ncbi:hypothetical protein N9X12_07935 [Alphaproteobacteria bacterium]|nr:hypothetical protein [Alphaproteobacteria bacterium]
MRMILISAVVLAGLGTTLYQVKTGIDARQDQLKNLQLTIAATKRDIAVLEAEWAYLSRPERIMNLSSSLLNMEPISQDRILPLDAIPMRVTSEQKSQKPTPVFQNPEPKKPRAQAIKHTSITPDSNKRTQVSVALPEITLKDVNIKTILTGEDE